jgi:hypothetical protein
VLVRKNLAEAAASAGAAWYSCQKPRARAPHQDNGRVPCALNLFGANPAMKKLLLLSAVSLVASALATGQASAGIFDLFGGHGDDDHYHPYNAFDPYAEPSGHGHHHCCFGCCHHGHPCTPPIFIPPPIFMPPPCYPPPCCNDYCGCSCINSGCCDAGCLPAPEGDNGPPAPVAPDMPPSTNPKFTPPAPSPLPDTTETSSGPVADQTSMMPSAGGYPGYYPGYNQGFAGNYAGGYPGNYPTAMGNYGYYPTAMGNYGGYNAGYGAYPPPSPAGMYGAMRQFPMPYAPNAMPGYGAYGMPGYGGYGMPGYGYYGR